MPGRFFKGIPLALATVLLTACGGQGGDTRDMQPETDGPTGGPTTVMDAPSNQPEELADTRWKLTSLKGRDPAAGTEITLRIREGSLRGNGGCNFYSADRLNTDRGIFRIGAVESTMIGCKGPAGDQEQEYLEALQAAESYRLVDGRLEIKDASGEMVLIFEEER